MEIIAMVNQKGGVGKSTAAHILGAGLALKGKRVLYVDLDAQGNLSYTLKAENSGPTALDVLTYRVSAQEAIQQAQAPLIPSAPGLANADLELDQTGKEYRLREALEDLGGAYDYIVVDTPPALGILTVNALTACTGVVIPAQADIYSLQGIGQLYKTLAAVRKYTNPALRVRGILLTRYQPRTTLGRDIADLVEDTAKRLDTKAYKARIREAVAIREAQAKGADIFSYAPGSNVAADCIAWIKEFLRG